MREKCIEMSMIAVLLLRFRKLIKAESPEKKKTNCRSPFEILVFLATAGAFRIWLPFSFWDSRLWAMWDGVHASTAQIAVLLLRFNRIKVLEGTLEAYGWNCRSPFEILRWKQSWCGECRVRHHPELPFSFWDSTIILCHTASLPPFYTLPFSFWDSHREQYLSKLQ